MQINNLNRIATICEQQQKDNLQWIDSKKIYDSQRDQYQSEHILLQQQPQHQSQLLIHADSQIEQLTRQKSTEHNTNLANRQSNQQLLQQINKYAKTLSIDDLMFLMDDNQQINVKQQRTQPDKHLDFEKLRIERQNTKLHQIVNNLKNPELKKNQKQYESERLKLINILQDQVYGNNTSHLVKYSKIYQCEKNQKQKQIEKYNNPYDDVDFIDIYKFKSKLCSKFDSIQTKWEEINNKQLFPSQNKNNLNCK